MTETVKTIASNRQEAGLSRAGWKTLSLKAAVVRSGRAAERQRRSGEAPF
jgi:hypothetical protein